jgi:hypothetical protein
LNSHSQKEEAMTLLLHDAGAIMRRPRLSSPCNGRMPLASQSVDGIPASADYRSRTVYFRSTHT